MRRAQGIFRQLEDTQHEIRHLQEYEETELSVGSGPVWLTGLLPRAVNRRMNSSFFPLAHRVIQKTGAPFSPDAIAGTAREGMAAIGPAYFHVRAPRFQKPIFTKPKTH
jgi:hypothetical protein